ncbi:hypothetical protein [Thalassotalea eurytherma]|uniref:Uncharacterized protein n=1 Tax=Thalassotalea eurytherma TaxID=1144278 RepID=A0ABQ6H3S2_9GAMM|nr:hypothetical protein [Thalassotalea eurytherma]GLX82164.1 hypothetical protein theurythT_16160 [Thalassotalea eurytherma]
MTVKQFDPKQTTTLEAPKKVIEEQAKTAPKQGEFVQVSTPRVGFISLG